MHNKFKIRWKLVACNQGDQCWCRGIKPETPILNEDGAEIFIISTGQIEKEVAEYFVLLHNETFK